MFALGGQKSKANPDWEVQNGQVAVATEPNASPSIDVSESSVVLRRLLLTIYPPSNFVFPSLNELKPVMAAAHKYQMDPILDVLAQVLIRDFAKVEPLRVFCISTLYDLPIAQEAGARCFLSLSATDAAEAYVDELRDIDARAYHRLLACRRECVADLAEMFKSLSWFPDGIWVFTNTMPANCACGYEPVTYILQGPDGTDAERNIKRWFFAHYQRIATILLDRPCLEALEDPALCDQALKDAVNCGACRGVVHEHLRSFMKSLRNQIGERVSKTTSKMFYPA